MSTREDREIDAREDLVWESQHPDLSCESCFGEGITRDETECPECEGSGRIDPDAFDEPFWEPR